MPWPDSRYGEPCRSDQRSTVKVDLGASGLFYVPWEKWCVVPLLRAAARIKAWNVDHPDDVYIVRPGEFQTYNCRAVTGGSSWSIHAWPLAIDINPATNPYIASGAPAHHDLPDYFVDALVAEGFTWGGYWSRPKDYMHVEHKGWDGRSDLTPVDYTQFLATGGFLMALDEAAQLRLDARVARLDSFINGIDKYLGEKLPSEKGARLEAGQVLGLFVSEMHEAIGVHSQQIDQLEAKLETVLTKLDELLAK